MNRNTEKIDNVYIKPDSLGKYYTEPYNKGPIFKSINGRNFTTMEEAEAENREYYEYITNSYQKNEEEKGHRR